MGFPIGIELKLEEPRKPGEFPEHGHGMGILGTEGTEGAEGSVGSAAGAPGAFYAAEDHRGDHRAERIAQIGWDHTSRVAVAPVRLAIGRGSRWIAVAGGLGYFPVAPGTAGSLGGVLLFLLAMDQGVGFSRASFVALYVLAIGLLFVLGTRAAGRAEVDFGRRDDGRIVIDEVVGQLITFLPLTLFSGDDLSQIFSHVVTGFVLFRLFDVWKPGAVRWAERRFKGGLGVMADDVVAGLYAGVVLAMGMVVGFKLLGFKLFGFKLLAFKVGFEHWISSADSVSSIASRAWA